jgi:hypothetical protein
MEYLAHLIYYITRGGIDLKTDNQEDAQHCPIRKLELINTRPSLCYPNHPKYPTASQSPVLTRGS